MESVWSTVGTVQVNGVRLGYRESGDPAGEPMVLLHGTGSRAGTWDGFAARLTGHRVIAVDLRGHGASGRSRDYSLAALTDDLLSVLETFDLREAVVVGHSVGGYAALGAARLSPDRVARLVLEDPAAPPHGGPRRAPFSWPRLPGGLPAAAAGLLTAPRDYDLSAMWSIFRQVTRPDAGWWARLAEVRQPALVLSGGPASCIPPARLAELTDRLPDARLTTIPVGHRVHSLAPDEFGAVVDAFLDASHLTVS